MYETAYTLQGSGGKLPTQRFIEENGSEDLDNALRQQFINVLMEASGVPHTLA